jgi:hypothetical protein
VTRGRLGLRKGSFVVVLSNDFGAPEDGGCGAFSGSGHLVQRVDDCEIGFEHARSEFLFEVFAEGVASDVEDLGDLRLSNAQKGHAADFFRVAGLWLERSTARARTRAGAAGF